MTSRRVRNSFAIAFVALSVVSCAESATKPATIAKTATAGSRFDGVGRVAMHAGQPCSPQIMFDFRAAGSRAPIWLAAPVHESKTLTEAAKRNRRVHVWGTWQHGREKRCAYLNVTKVEAQKWIW